MSLLSDVVVLQLIQCMVVFFFIVILLIVTGLQNSVYGAYTKYEELSRTVFNIIYVMCTQKCHPKMVIPRHLAGNAEEEEEAC